MEELRMAVQEAGRSTHENVIGLLRLEWVGIVSHLQNIVSHLQNIDD